MANHHSRLAAVLALLFFAALAALPWLTQLYQGTQSTAPPSWVRAARHAAVVPLRHAPGRLPAVKISPTARPVRAGDPPASLQVADSSRMAPLDRKLLRSSWIISS